MLWLILKLLGFYLVWALIWWMLSRITSKKSIADIAWGLSFICLALLCLFLDSTNTPTQLLASFFIFVWGLRLSIHIFKRSRYKPEDPRYVVMRDRWGDWEAIRSFTDVFLLQALLGLLVGIPIIYLIIDGYTMLPIQWFGALVFIVGFMIEVIADWQLATFVKTKKAGEIMMSGLWRYSRHPNYFGEIVLWWGIGLFALGVRGGILALIGPLTLTLLIVFVSGVPLVEKRYQDNSRYQAYRLSTRMLLPWPPKHL